MNYNLEFHNPNWNSNLECQSEIPNFNLNFQIGKPNLNLELQIGIQNCNLEFKTGPPQNYTMVNAYPNPFNSNTFITLQNMGNTFVKLDIIVLNGHIIDSIYSGYLSGLNTHTFLWDGNGNNSGIYFARISNNEQLLTHKIILLK